MEKNKRIQFKWRFASGIVILLLALVIGFSAEQFTIVSRAESEGKVTATSAKIRKEPNTSSASLASAMKDAKVSIKGQLTGDDGYTWYQVYVDADTLGYVRSDLVQITDGSTPPKATVTASTGGNTTPADTPGSDENLVGVTAVNPVSANVVGGQAVRVRQNASTTSRIVTTVKSGVALTVTGTAVGTDGKDWYQVNFISNSSEVNGFIRSEYVTVSEELTPMETEEPGDIDEPSYEPVEPEPEVTKDWDTYYEGGKWHLSDNLNNDVYDIENIFQIAEENKKIAEEALSAKKTQKIVIIVLVILLIGLAALVSYLIFRVKDMADSAYFNEVERETARRRTADRPQRSQTGQRPVNQRPAGQRPAGQRPVGGGADQRSAGQRPAGQRPVGSGADQRPAGQRPAGQRPVGSGADQRPVGQRPVGQRPVGSGADQRSAGQRPAGQRPVGNGADQRPAGQRPVGQRPVGGAADQRPAGQRPAGTSPQQGNREREPGWKSKNFMAEEDDFEYKFMDWEGDDNE